MSKISKNTSVRCKTCDGDYYENECIPCATHRAIKALQIAAVTEGATFERNEDGVIEIVFNRDIKNLQ